MFTVAAGRTEVSHRVAYILSCGNVPDGLHVCHRCDNPQCVNPSHLFLGTAKDNVTDMWRKGRAQNYLDQCKGSEVHLAKLDERQVEDIRSAISRHPVKAIAAQYGVTISTIYDIKRRRTWKHVATGLGQ